MKKNLGIVALVSILSMAGVLGIAAQEKAGPDDLANVQAQLANLEAQLESLEDGELTPELERRVEDIRDSAVYLKVKMQKNQEDPQNPAVTVVETRELEQKIATLRSDLRRQRADRAAGNLTLASGTELSLRLQTSLSSASAEPGDSFSATVVEPVSVDGEVAIPAGALVTGRVEMVDSVQSRTDRKARLALGFENIEIEGKTYSLDATVTDASENLETGIKGEAKKIGIGAGIGTILGAVIGGTEGALIGAVLGGTGIILGTEGNEVQLPAGTVLDLRLDRDLTVSAPTT